MTSVTLKSFVITSLCLSLISCSPLIAQDVGSSGGMQVMGMSFGSGPTGGDSFEFYGGNDMTGGGMSGPETGPIDAISLLDNKQVQEELELVGYQLQKFRDAKKQMQKELEEKTKALLSGGFDMSQVGSLAKQLKALRSESKTQLEASLLPHQLERLKQLALQAQMKQRGAANTLVSDGIAEELGIDADQRQRIKERAEELKQELAQRMEDLKKEFRGKLFEELTGAQKAKLKELSGADFDYKAKSKEKSGVENQRSNELPD